MATKRPQRILPPTLPELLSLQREESANKDAKVSTYVTVHPPAAMGFGPAAFGGNTMAAAAVAAVSTLAPSQAHFRAYSLLGNFLGPALIDRKLRCVVRSVRDTRTFVTRVVEVRQRTGEVDKATGEGVGEERTVLLMTVDFQAPEKASEMVFSAKPSRDWGRPEDGKGFPQRLDEYLAKGFMDKAAKEMCLKSFGTALAYFETIYCPGSPLGESLMGLGRRLSPLSQQDLPHAERISGDWFRCTSTLDSGQKEQLGALAFVMDFATSFAPLAQNGQWLGDVKACSSLEFALRVYGNEISLNQWHLREMSALVAREGRAFTESKLWNDRGELLAMMSQQVIIRPHEKDNAKI